MPAMIATTHVHPPPGVLYQTSSLAGTKHAASDPNSRDTTPTPVRFTCNTKRVRIIEPGGKRSLPCDELESDTEGRKANGGGEKLRLPTNAASMFKKFVASALDGQVSGNASQYQELRRKFQIDPSKSVDAPSQSELQMILSALANVASRLNDKFAALVRDIIDTVWTPRSGDFVNAYVRFLGNLVSAHPNYVGDVIKMLVQQLGHLPSHAGQLPRHTPVNRATMYDRVHYALQYILELVPTAGHSKLQPALVAEFPHKSESKLAHSMYLRNLLRVIEYAPALRSQLLAVVTDRVIKIDLSIQKELDELDDDAAVIEDLEADLSAPPTKKTSVIRRGDEDEDDEEEDLWDDEDEQDESGNIKETVAKLDSMLDLLFNFYSTQLPSKYSAKPTLSELTTFDVILRTFDTTVLPTAKSRYTQFLVFWASQRSSEFLQLFCISIIQKALNQAHSEHSRKAAAYYIASFVARVKEISKRDVQAVVNIMCRWMGDFLDMREIQCQGPDLKKWGSFYAVVQAVMYIFCFRWRDLKEVDEIDENDWDVPEERWLGGINILKSVITSRFNPLKVCSPLIVEMFAKIAHHLEFMYCHSIIEQNKRRGMLSENQQLETYFPFDPYYLKSSRKWIDPVYVEWQPVPGMEEDSDSEEEEEDDEDDDDEDEGEDDDEVEVETPQSV